MTSWKCATPGKTKRVTFASTHTSIAIPATLRLSPKNARERARLLRARKATPHKKRASRLPTPSPAMNRRHEAKKPRLVESGAVRVQIDRYTNQRRLVNHGSTRLIDQGAMRVNITRHTTPRRLYATRKRIWSPPPSSCKKRVPQSEKIPKRIMAEQSIPTTTTPSKKRSNALVGGHRFRACLSPGYFDSTPCIAEIHKENADNIRFELEKGLAKPRTLFD